MIGIRRIAPATAVVMVVASLVLSACAEAGSAPPPIAPGGEGERLDQGLPPAVAPGAPTDRSDGGGMTALIEPRIIKTGEITLEADDVAATLGKVRALATRLDGYVGASQSGAFGEGGTLTLRIPASRFDEALTALHEIGGKVIAEATREQDVTSQIVDLRARIENLEASEAAYRALVNRATEIEDILAVQARLDEVRGEIERMSAQLESVSDQADLSTLTVSVVPAALATQSSDWDPGQVFEEAVTTLLGIGQGIVGGLIWFGVVVLPIGLVLAFVVLLILRSGILARRESVVPAVKADTVVPGAATGAGTGNPADGD